MPHSLRLGFNTLNGGEDDDNAVENSEGTLDFDRKVHMARCVDDMNVMTPPQACRHRRGDGNPPLLFQLHPVHYRITVMDFSHSMGPPGIVKNPFGNRGFPCIDMGHEPYVSRLFELFPGCHVLRLDESSDMVIKKELRKL